MAIDKAVKLHYRNHRGEVAIRTIIPRELRFGSSQHHHDLQWLLECYDVDKQENRTYALRDCDFACGRLLNPDRVR